MIPKFRAWDKNTKKMNGMAEIYRNRKQEIELLPRDDNIILMQSTGLFDKNDKEIFESDIVKTTRFFGRADESGGFYEYEKEFIGIVKQLEGAWIIDTEKGAVYLWSDIDENEVLGNIWENPKLLEEIKDE